MSETLIIVESPTKARTLSNFLGNKYKIEASMGHVRDLPKAKLGVDVEKNFEPEYVIPRAKRKTVEHLRDILGAAKNIILATDPDREGEAIAWHVQQLAAGIQNKAKLGSLGTKLKSRTKEDSKFSRIVFHEITKEAVAAALKSPRTIDLKLVDAQVARRVLDRLVGYKLSPLLWKKVKSGLSAGRVQSVTVRLIVEREREIEQFVSVEYWSIAALLREQMPNRSLRALRPLRGLDKAQMPNEFEAELVQKQGKKVQIKNNKEADTIVKDLEKPETNWQVSQKEEKEVKKYPGPPFTTSTMTQTAANSFGFTAKKTMKLAQDLYEQGYITYHRTDSLNLAPIALNSARKYIKETFGPEFLPTSVRVYKTKSKLAQEAHEAIRPTDVGISNVKIQMSNDHKKLYDLIWKRFVAGQMAEAVYDQVTLEVTATRDQRPETSYLFRAVGSVVKFPGYQKVYGREEGDIAGEEKIVPPLTQGTKLDLNKILPSQHFTQPPPRYTEASLIKTLEEKGIGRPSTYAPIISTIQERNYVELEQRKFRPTPLGAAVNDFLVKNFPGVFDYSFTAKMEESLDDIAGGEKKWVPTVSEFYGPFSEKLAKTFEESDKVKVFLELTSEKCPEGHPLVIRYGRFGKFLACEAFPEHKYTKAFEERLDAKCPESEDSIVVKRTRRGRPFYGCGGYPKCKWMSWRLPQQELVKQRSDTPTKTI
ncbi:MAG: type I DNA topoisomerase [bacterium]|nr:type I DNA topoisomerase [bacterium]